MELNNGGGGDSRTVSDRTREKISRSLTGRKRSLFTRVKMSIARKGKISKPQTKETRQKLKIMNLGRNNPNDKLYTLGFWKMLL